jgi:predicted TIM-barrel enzyme
MSKVHCVIHHLDLQTSLEQVGIARACGADGVFLISHHQDDEAVLVAASAAKEFFTEFQVGINLLSSDPRYACQQALARSLDMVWADYMGVDSFAFTAMGLELSEFALKTPQIQLFASVAFKYQAVETNPKRAALNALRLGFIPTTSGVGTGHAPQLDKIESMSKEVKGRLAIASGMTPENIHLFAPYVSHVLVSTGVSKDEYHLDDARLRAFVATVRNGTLSVR